MANDPTDETSRDDARVGRSDWPGRKLSRRALRDAAPECSTSPDEGGLTCKQLTERLWAMNGWEIPRYSREDMPVVIKRRRQQSEE